MSPPYRAMAYGCTWHSAFPLPFFQTAAGPGKSRDDLLVRVSLRTDEAPSRASFFANGRQRFCADGLRYLDDDGTVIDVYGIDRMELTPGSAWNGNPPPAFYGTCTAALLAARGCLPIHGSAVDVGGRAVLLCGHSGAGKSTLTAALIAAGAKLLSDDLSEIHLKPRGGQPAVFTGRRAIRLFPDVAGFLRDEVSAETVELPGEAKVLAMPPVAAADEELSLAAVLVLSGDGPVSPAGAASLELLEYSFRRRAFRYLPGFDERVELARRVAAAVPFVRLPPVQARTPAAFQAAAESALEQLASAGVGG